MKNNALLWTCLLGLSLGFELQGQTIKTLNASPSFGTHGDGSILPGDQSWVDSSDMNQRGIAYDPVTGRLVYVNTHSGSGGSAAVQGTIEILDGVTGEEVSTLNTTGISGGSYADFAAGVADDGAVYVCNQVTASANSPFKIYRWDSVNSTDPPVLAFSGTITPSQRYGSSFDVRGAGTGTQIIIGSMPGTTATNVVIFTTSDGTHFVAHVLGADTTTANYNDGIAFGSGNTFWAKRIGAPLRLMSFDLDAGSAVTLASFTADTMPNVANLGPIAVDNANQLLAAIELKGGTVSGGPERVWLFDIADTSKAPALLGYRDFTPNNVNATAPLGYLDFGGNQLYAAVTRNGILASTVDDVPTPLPVITKDLFATNRVAVGQTAHFEVQAYPGVTNYEWYVDGDLIEGATNYFLDVPNVQTNHTGRIYSVVVANAAGTTPSANSFLHVINPADLFHLNLLWRAAQPSFGGSPGPTNWYVGTGAGVPTERTIAYNAVSNQFYVVYRSGSNVRITVIDPDTGHSLYTLNTNGIATGTAGGNIPLCAIAVADDGAIYACNSVAAADVDNFKVYRWENSDPNTLPVLIFTGNPAADLTSSSYRWGDVMDVRGSGMDTELIFDTQNDTRYLALLQPSDETMTNTWIAKSYLLQNVPNGPGGGAGGMGIGRSIQFGPGDSVWQKRWATAGGPLCESSFDPALPATVAPLVTSSSGLPLLTNGPIGMEFSLKLGAAINFAAAGAVASIPDSLDMYDLTSPLTPVLLNRYNFPVNATANGNRIGQVIFTTNYVLAIDANNGVMAFTLAAGPIPPPTFLSQPKNRRIIQGGSAVLDVVIDQTATINWLKDGVEVGSGASFAISNAQPSDAGNYWAIGSNSHGSTTSEVAVVTIRLPNDNYALAPAWSTAPGTVVGTDYVTSNGGGNTPNERAFAYNALSNQILIVQCPVAPAPPLGSPSGVIPTIAIIDASTGVKLYNLHTEGIENTTSYVAGSNPLNLVAIAVSEDGAVYACNGTPNASGGPNDDPEGKLRIYRWANSGPDTLPEKIFTGDPSGQPPGVNVRWGDVLSARGSGAGTELLLDSNDGVYGAVLTPVDSSVTSFTNDYFLSLGLSGSIGRSIQFGETNHVWQKRRGGNLYFSAYNVSSQTSAQEARVDFLSTTLGGVAVDAARNLVAGVDFVGNASNPDAVALYEISDLETPMLIARYNMPANQPGNANSIAQTIIAGDKVFALDGNSGFAAFDLVAPGSPELTATIANGQITISWPASVTGYKLQFTPALSPANWQDVTTPTNAFNSVTENAETGAKFYRLFK